MPEDFPTLERAVELLVPLIEEYRDRLIYPEQDDTPRGIYEDLQCERERPWMLDDAELLWNLADIADVLDTPNSEVLAND